MNKRVLALFWEEFWRRVDEKEAEEEAKIVENG